MVSDAAPVEGVAVTTLSATVSTSGQRRISTITSVSSHPILNTKRSQRKLQVRPSHPTLSQQRLDDAAITTDMRRTSVKPAVQPKKSSSSLFNLFSKPKVEKAKAYGGEVVAAPAPVQIKAHSPSKSSLKSNPPLPRHAPPVRPPSQQIKPTPILRSSGPASNAPIPPTTSQRLKFEEPTRTSIKADKNVVWAPPPLFQAFARSTKHGLAETSVSSTDKHAARARAIAREKELDESQPNNRSSLNSEISDAATQKTRMTVQTLKGLSSTHVDVPQKIIVLLDDGHLLQYSQHGPTNRLPEKVLQLSPESAASVSDVTPQSHGVLRIVQTAGTRSFSLQSTVNALSRLTRRTMNSKRDVPNLQFVFQHHQDMKEWLHAIRKHIDALNRSPSVSSHAPSEQLPVDSVIEGSDALSETEAKMPTATTTTPPSKPIAEDLSAITALPPITSQPPLQPMPVQSHTVSDDDSDDSPRGKGSLEMVEAEAEKLLIDPPKRMSIMSSSKRISDAPSFTSSSAPSIDAQALTNIRNSARMSHISAITGMTSRTNSMSSEPSSNKAMSEHSGDNGSVKSPYRNLSSYQSAKRRSALPLVATIAASQPIIELTFPSHAQAPADHTSLGAISPMPTPTSTTSTSVSRSPVMRSPPTHYSTPEVQTADQAARDSTPTIAEEDERPESIVADLPPPSAWNSKLSPQKRYSSSFTPSTNRQQHRMSSAPSIPTQQQIEASLSRRASHSFRLPLKINPDLPANRPPPRNKSRSSVAPEAVDEKPRVFTLEAKVDPRTHRMSVGHHSYSSPELRHRASQRLSLFPSPLLSQSSIPELSQKRSGSISGPAQIAPEAVPSRRASLQRPTSMQVRSNHAPFLSSVRRASTMTAPSIESTSHPSTTMGQTWTAPIRQLKPSRSTSAISSISSVQECGRPASPTDPFTGGRTPMSNDDEDVQMPRRRQSYAIRASYVPSMGPPMAPLPMAPLAMAPGIVPMGNSFAQQKSLRRTSLRPRQSVIAPLSSIEALGPPAPPPNAPLPAPPDGAPPGILSLGTTPVSPPMRSAARLSSQPQHSNGLGIRV